MESLRTGETMYMYIYGGRAGEFWKGKETTVITRFGGRAVQQAGSRLITERNISVLKLEDAYTCVLTTRLFIQIDIP
jgi:hypothetical protein